MPDFQVELLARLQEDGIPVVGSIIEDSDVNGFHYVRVAVTRDSNNLQQPSNRRLTDLKATLAAEGRRVEFLLHDASGLDLEAGLRATLLNAFPNDLRNVFLSADGPKARVWVEPKHALNDEEVKRIEQKARDYLEVLGVQLHKLVATGDENLPSNFACLRVLRQVAPASFDELKVELAKSFTIPSEDWLKRRLDMLRRTGKVVWIAGGSYACSLDALRGLGSARGKNSPDVRRLLALARGGR